MKNTFTMKKETRESLQVGSALGMLALGMALTVAGFIVSPLGEIHESVLGLFAECLIYAGSIFGVAIYAHNKYAEIKTYVEEKMSATRN